MTSKVGWDDAFFGKKKVECGHRSLCNLRVKWENTACKGIVN